MNALNYTNTIGDSSVGELVLSLIFVVFIYVGIIAYLIYLVKIYGRKHMPIYPTIEEFNNASDQQVVEWEKTLPTPRTPQEKCMINRIITRYSRIIVDGIEIPDYHETLKNASK